MTRVGVANFVATLALICLFFVLKEIGIKFGQGIGMAFASGGLFFTVIWQLAHKSRYGVWFDLPVIPPTTPMRGETDKRGAGE